ncbi:MAG TPA: NUDIX domain-containing protein [Bryobacteraceae bacterium]
MPKRSAGLMMYRRRDSHLEVFLVHPGGPFWSRKEFGVWSIPKGEYVEQETPLEVAKREFEEETGFPPGELFLELGDLTQPSRKIVRAWAFEGDCDPGMLRSNTCLIEWPPRSGRQIEVPEVDRGDWFTVEEARSRLLTGQQVFLDRLIAALRGIG